MVEVIVWILVAIAVIAIDIIYSKYVIVKDINVSIMEYLMLFLEILEISIA